MAKNGKGKTESQESQVASEEIDAKEEPRVRLKGAGPSCAECGGDMFVESSRAYPEFLRVRHYRCGKCGRTGKQVTRDDTGEI